MDALNTMDVFIPCRTSGCKSTIREKVAIGFDMDSLLSRHGWQRSRSDGIGYFCNVCRPGATVLRVQAEDLPDVSTAHLFPDDKMSRRMARAARLSPRKRKRAR